MGKGCKGPTSRECEILAYWQSWHCRTYF